MKQAVPLSLILNELVTNALKHAAAADLDVVVDIRCNINDTGILLNIVNAGFLADDFDFFSASGLGTGLDLVKTMLPSTGAQLKIFQQGERVVTELELIEPLISLITDAPRGHSG